MLRRSRLATSCGQEAQAGFLGWLLEFFIANSDFRKKKKKDVAVQAAVRFLHEKADASQDGQAGMATDDRGKTSMGAVSSISTKVDP